MTDASSPAAGDLDLLLSMCKSASVLVLITLMLLLACVAVVTFGCPCWWRQSRRPRAWLCPQVGLGMMVLGVRVEALGGPGLKVWLLPQVHCQQCSVTPRWPSRH